MPSSRTQELVFPSAGSSLRRAAAGLGSAADPLVLLSELSHQLQVLGGVDEICQTHLDAITGPLGYQAGFIAIVNREEGKLKGRVAVNFPEDVIDALDVSISEPHSIKVDVVMGGRPAIIGDLAQDIRVSVRLYHVLNEGGFRSAVLMPMLSGLQEEPVCCERDSAPEDWRQNFSPRCLNCHRYPVEGILIVADRDRELTPHDLDVLTPFANQIGAALANMQLLRRIRQSLETVEAERDWLGAVVNNVPEPVILTDLNNTILLENEKAKELFAISDEDSEGKQRACSMNNFLLSVVLSGYSVDERPRPRELALVDPIEGQELLYEIVSTRSRNLRTGEEGIVSVLRNVTDLKRASDELRSSFERVQELGYEARTERQRLNLIIQSVGDPVLVTDVNNDVLLMNGQAERVFSHPEVLETDNGRDDTKRARYEANDARFTTFISQLRIGTSGTKTGELELIDPDGGDPISLSVTSGEIMDERGQLDAVISILHDLTKVRELERRQLEQQLFESEKLAAVGRLAASIAHEINNPLEAIKNALYLISRKFKGDPRDRQFIEIANRETARVSRIIHEMLGFYRPSITPGPVNVNAVLEDVLVLLEKQLHNHHVSVGRELSTDLPSIMGHADQLKQVFLNIMLNNQDAMPHGGRLLVRTFRAIETNPSAETRDVVNVEFTDTGEGIRPEILPHIFEPFFSTKAEKGTGLGLWVSFGIVQSHNGHISVKSQPSHGTSFTISFPAMAQV